MVKDYIGYPALADAAMRGIAREALRVVAEKGLLGNHHFFIAFKTHAPGVDIPDFLKEEYPDEITIVLQHQFWGLSVDDEAFDVTLTFRKVPATLHVPFAALTSFVDKGANFGLQFNLKPEPGPRVAAEPSALATPAALPQDTSRAAGEKRAGAPKSLPKDASAGQGAGAVVSLDQFRKK